MDTLQMLHLGDQESQMFTVLALPPTALCDDISRSLQRRFAEYLRDLSSPCVCNEFEIRTVDPFFDVSIDGVACKKFAREPPLVIERLLHALVTFIAAITKPYKPVGGMTQVVTNFLFGPCCDLGQALIAAGYERFQLQQIK